VPTSNEDLLQAVRDLRLGIQELTETLTEYPKRDEVEKRFATQAKALKRFWIVIGLILASLVISFVSTISTVSWCFLNADPHPATCNIIPGYNRVQERNTALIEEFHEMRRMIRDLYEDERP
jgi:hypothetical protein